MYKYRSLVSGGTFDRLHHGHKAFLLAQFSLSDHVFIGVTSDKYIQKYKSDRNITPFTTRLATLTKFLAQNQLLDRVDIEAIDDGNLPLVWENFPIEAIAVTENTKQGAEHVNKLRKEKGLSPFEIIVLPYTLDKGKEIISSSRIRKGEIDTKGNILVLPENLRQQLQLPFGQLFTSLDAWIEKNTIAADKTITIGDEVSEQLWKLKFGQKVAVVDLLVQRQKKYSNISDHAIMGDEHILAIKNPAGHITPELFQAAKISLKNKGKYVICIDGEEDLAVLPFIVVAPLGFQIIYGQPGEGIVCVFVTEESQKRAKDLLEKFLSPASENAL